MLREAQADKAVLQLKSYETLSKMADGQATKIILPANLQNVATFGTLLEETIGSEFKKHPEKLEDLIEYIKNKKVLILGFGREGKSTLNYIRKHLPDKELFVSDKNKPEIDDENVKVIFGDDYLKCLGDFDIVFNKNPPAYISYLGKVLPAALIGMLVIYCLKDVSVLESPHGIPELIAALSVVLLQAWKRNSLISILSGTVIYMLLVQLVF